MQKVLAEEFRIPVKWVEGASRDTAENAHFSAAILRGNGITRLTLVSHSSHLPRAIPLFEQQGLIVTAAPIDFSARSTLSIEDFLPEGQGKSRDALREHLGQLFNRIKDALP